MSIWTIHFKRFIGLSDTNATTEPVAAIFPWQPKLHNRTT